MKFTNIRSSDFVIQKYFWLLNLDQIPQIRTKEFSLFRIEIKKSVPSTYWVTFLVQGKIYKNLSTMHCCFNWVPSNVCPALNCGKHIMIGSIYSKIKINSFQLMLLLHFYTFWKYQKVRLKTCSSHQKTWVASLNLTAFLSNSSVISC